LQVCIMLLLNYTIKESPPSLSHMPIEVVHKAQLVL
jgi:hypothetical protein